MFAGLSAHDGELRIARIPASVSDHGGRVGAVDHRCNQGEQKRAVALSDQHSVREGLIAAHHPRRSTGHWSITSLPDATAPEATASGDASSIR